MITSFLEHFINIVRISLDINEYIYKRYSSQFVILANAQTISSIWFNMANSIYAHKILNRFYVFQIIDSIFISIRGRFNFARLVALELPRHKSHK